MAKTRNPNPKTPSKKDRGTPKKEEEATKDEVDIEEELTDINRPKKKPAKKKNEVWRHEGKETKTQIIMLPKTFFKNKSLLLKYD